MAQAAPIVINDGKATPVATTFSPEEVSTAISTFVDRTAGVSAGYKRLTTGFKAARGNTRVNRGKYAIEMPVTQTVNGITSVAYILRANVDTIIPDQATVAERNDLFAFLYNGLNHSLIKGVVRDSDPTY
jgi:hypothetical protein